ncbi:MAG: FAD-dependent oxidoreductase [Gammaproteobacteria bacterium]|nr:FAD-dependent oxidoreductase [Gammaproteobacteria bacterium]MBQ0841188.1 FAD-dependent oxidoreductase [Gammaproteobacteria bacterium]
MPASSDTLNSSDNVQVDITIIGGGIAGLWLLHRLCKLGYNAILLESKALGSDQSVASQGMIHGGIKYSLSGLLTGASEAIADMPGYWRKCLQGEGEIDLRGCKLLSDHFYLWSSASTTSRLTTFFASKATRGRVDKVSGKQLPPLLQASEFSGSVYKLVDMVLDVPSLVRQLAEPLRSRIFQIDWQTAKFQGQPDTGHAIEIVSGAQTLRLNSAAIVLTAGQGNGALLKQLGASSPAMQTRPLQQVLVKHRHPHAFFGHCLGAETTPRVTISSHACDDGSQVWYLGGSLAEKGAGQSSNELILCAKRELSELLPWVDLSEAQWATLAVERAEPLQRNFARPDQAYADWAGNCQNVIAAWPTKLTLAPNLATQIVDLLAKKGIKPRYSSPLKLPLKTPKVAPPPWQTLFGDD